MGDESFESMYDEVGLAADDHATVTAMMADVRAAAAELPAPVPGPELAAMLGAPPVRRIAHRRRAAAAGVAALVLGSLGGAAAAQVLPEPVQRLVTELPPSPDRSPAVEPDAPEDAGTPAAPTDVPATPPPVTPPSDQPSSAAEKNDGTAGREHGTDGKQLRDSRPPTRGSGSDRGAHNGPPAHVRTGPPKQPPRAPVDAPRAERGPATDRPRTAPRPRVSTDEKRARPQVQRRR